MLRATKGLTLCLIAALSAMQFGCASTILTKDDRTSFDRKVEKNHHIALFGFWEVSPPVSPKAVCGLSQWTKIESQFTILNVAVGVLTAGLYTPATVTVSCRDFQSRR